jgi:hypothetical protein
MCAHAPNPTTTPIRSTHEHIGTFGTFPDPERDSCRPPPKTARAGLVRLHADGGVHTASACTRAQPGLLTLTLVSDVPGLQVQWALALTRTSGHHPNTHALVLTFSPTLTLPPP